MLLNNKWYWCRNSVYQFLSIPLPWRCPPNCCVISDWPAIRSRGLRYIPTDAAFRNGSDLRSRQCQQLTSRSATAEHRIRPRRHLLSHSLISQPESDSSLAIAANNRFCLQSAAAAAIACIPGIFGGQSFGRTRRLCSSWAAIALLYVTWINEDGDANDLCYHNIR